MLAQGWSVATPWESQEQNLQTLKALAKLANWIRERCQRSYSLFCRTQGTNPGLKFANSFGVQSR